MKNISKEANVVLETIEKYGPTRSGEIAKMLNISIKNVYKHLRNLQEECLIKKTGETPVVFYTISENYGDNLSVSDKNDRLIEQNYIYVSPNGEMILGIKGFSAWCQKNKFDFEKEKKLFAKKFGLVQKTKKNGLISAKKSILSNKEPLSLDNIFFSDFYTVDHFGKTKLGQLVYLGKSSQNRKIIQEVADLVRPSILNMIKKQNIKFVCFVPPTISRKVQFMEVLKKSLKLNLPEITAVKIPSLIKVPQKTLRKLEDRIINAQKTIAVNPSQKVDNVLIIDDATGSGATMNETAKKIKNIAKGKIKVIGYSVVGSFKGFDVISEV